LAEKTKKAPTKAASRKVKDRWKAKEWYKIHAPMMFNQVQLGETPSADPSSLVGRMTEVTVHDLTGDFSKMHVKLKFKVDDVRGFDAHTVFVGQDLTSDYIRRLTRRKKTKTDHVVDVHTKDGYLIRVKPMSITDKRIQASQESAVRNIMTQEVQKMGAEMTISDLVKSIISGDLARRLSTASKVIVPIKRVEIRKTEVLEMGSAASQEQSIIERPAAEAPAPAPEAAAAEAAPAEETEELPAEETETEELEEGAEEESNETEEGSEDTGEK
jgi:small subunit ribosomal protein S3Ae